MVFAIVKTGGKQYKVEAGKKIKVEKLEAGQNGAVVFNDVLLVADGGKVEIGTPLVSGAKVSGVVSKQGRDRKKIVFHYHSKTRYRKKKGHRQPFTEVEIKEVKF